MATLSWLPRISDRRLRKVADVTKLFDKEMGKIAAEESPVSKRFRRLYRETFERHYPQLTDEDIERALEMCGSFGELEVRILQSFYRTVSYLETAEELQLPPRSPQAKVRHTILKAFDRLPEDSPLRTALRMAEDNRNIRNIRERS